MENYTNSEMTDMLLFYGSADGVGLFVVFRIRKHFWLLSTGKWYFSIAFVSKSFMNDSNVR
jgi:hypothetical protein